MSAEDPAVIVVITRGNCELTRWAVTPIGRPDLELVDTLARLRLAARRFGCAVHLEDAPPCLVALLDLAGLADELPSADPSDE